MKDNRFIEIGAALLLTVLIGILTYAHEAWMPSMNTMISLVLIVAMYSVFAVFVWKESDGDEREHLIRFVGSRAAFLATGAVLLIGIIYETLVTYSPNPWLSAALVTMVLAKILGHIYGQNKY